MAVRLLALICSFKLVTGKQEGFIVGGDHVKSIQDFPHVAFLSLLDKQAENLICGSSILNQVILITAAHCLDDVIQIDAFVGNLNREKGKLHRINSYVQHKKWDRNNITNDIGLCKLNKPLSLGNNIKRLVLMKQPPSAKTADVAGWGATEEVDYSDTIQLKHTIQKLWNHEQCQKVLHGAPKGTICGGEKKAGSNYASHGDSGSALLINKNIIVGVVSFKDTTTSRSLVVYTDVPYFYDWIIRESKRLICS